jgi:serine/threonine protein kinase
LDSLPAGSLPPEAAPASARYNKVRKLGQGATADVHLAYSPSPDDPDRVVALKCARTELVGSPGLSDMFAQEAHLISKFHHPNVVRLLDQGADEIERPFLALEYLNGQSLADVLNAAVEKDITIPSGVVSRIGVAALAGLDHVHNTVDLDGEPFGIVHCDVSPHNLFVTYGGDVKLVDFGFTQSRDSEIAFDVAGRSAYLAPEVLAGESFDARADVFSLGVVLWELVARVRLFKRQSDELTREALRHGHVPGLVARAPSCPDELDEIIKKSLSRSPDGRYESAAAMRDALLAFLADQSALLEQNAVASFMTDLFGAKSRDVVLARERAEARQSQADSEPPTLLRTPPPIEDEPPAEELLRTPRRSTITPKPPSSAAVHQTVDPPLEQDVTAPSPGVVVRPTQAASAASDAVTPAPSPAKNDETRSPLGRYTLPSAIALAIALIALLLFALSSR